MVSHLKLQNNLGIVNYLQAVFFAEELAYQFGLKKKRKDDNLVIQKKEKNEQEKFRWSTTVYKVYNRQRL